MLKRKATSPVALRFLNASRVTPQKSRYLWDLRQPMGAVTLLGGDPGQGKTQVAIKVAAQVTQGTLRGDLHKQPARVVIVSAEDSIRHTLTPRLIAAGADLNLVQFLEVKRDGTTGFLVLPDDVQTLGRQLQQIQPQLLIIDPLAAHLSMALNSFSDQHVRQAMGPLAKLSEELRISILVIAHLSKDQDRQALYRVGGSIAFTAAARSVLLVAQDHSQSGSPSFLLGHVKSNLGPLAPTLRYEVEAVTVPHSPSGQQFSTSKIRWMGEEPFIPGPKIFSLSDSSEKSGSQIEVAKCFLRFVLQKGGKSKKEILEGAKVFKISMTTLERAKAELKIQSEKIGFDDGWVWKLPVPKGTASRPVAKHRTSSPARPMAVIEDTE